MLLESLRQQVLHANKEIARRGLAPHTFGNASGIDRSGSQPLVVIKPSGVDYATLTAAIIDAQQDWFPAGGGRLEPRRHLAWHPGGDAGVVHAGGEQDRRVGGLIFPVVIGAHCVKALETLFSPGGAELRYVCLAIR